MENIEDNEEKNTEDGNGQEKGKDLALKIIISTKDVDRPIAKAFTSSDALSSSRYFSFLCSCALSTFSKVTPPAAPRAP